MRTKLGNLLTVYAGPFGKNVCLKSLKRTFGKYGHVRSITAITETVQVNRKQSDIAERRKQHILFRVAFLPWAVRGQGSFCLSQWVLA